VFTLAPPYHPARGHARASSITLLGLHPVQVEWPRAVMDCKDFHNVLPVSVYDAIAVHEDLPDGGLANLRNDAAGVGKVSKTIGGVECSAREDGGHAGRVASDEQADCLEVIRGLTGPSYFSYFSHCAILRRASAWVMVSPASACARPRSIFRRR